MASHGGGQAPPANAVTADRQPDPPHVRLAALSAESQLQADIRDRMAAKVEWCRDRLAAAEDEWRGHLADAQAELAAAQAALDETAAAIAALKGGEA